MRPEERRQAIEAIAWPRKPDEPQASPTQTAGKLKR